MEWMHFDADFHQLSKKFIAIPAKVFSPKKFISNGFWKKRNWTLYYDNLMRVWKKFATTRYYKCGKKYVPNFLALVKNISLFCETLNNYFLT